KPLVILPARWLLAAAPSELDLQRDQLAQQRRPLRLGERTHEVLDPLILSPSPGSLEAIAAGIDPPRGRIRAPVVSGRRHLDGHVSFSSQVWRIMSNLRFTVDRAQPIVSATSSRV